MKLPFLSERRQDSPEPQKNSEYESNVLNGSDEQSDVRGLSDLYSPDQAGKSHVYDIADALMDMGKIDSGQYARLRQEQRTKQNVDVAELLLQAGLIDAVDILKAKAKLYGLEFQRIKPEDVQRQAYEKLEVNFIRGSSICPIAIEQTGSENQEEILVVATSEPANVFAIEDVKKQTQMNLRIVVCSNEDIEAVCDSFREEEKVDYNLDDLISDMADVEVVQDEQDENEDLEQMAGQSPVIKFVNFVISNAVREGASDIHIEPKEKFMRTRYRIDGVLFETMQSPIKMHPAIVSRIKIMSNLDISERRLPQDGKIKVSIGGKAIDLRVSTLPTNYGEKVVIRVLDSGSILRGLEQLGMEHDVMEAFHRQVELPHGILLVTGPTGSGKSTTLYSALCQMDGDKLNISTVEDPVEYELNFCNQVQANEKIGLDFGSALRSLLRQDPDVIMIGEIRDNETARIAVQAALTGHLVLSTLHTNDAASSITRLVNIGIDAYLIAASLNASLAQRLVRKICPRCKEVYEVSEHIRGYIERAGVETGELYHGAGCDYCRGSGYAGRVGIYELLEIDDQFRDMINQDSSVSNMRRVFRRSGQRSLFDDGILKVKLGLTTIEEVLRVTEVYGKNEDEVFVENVA